MENRVNSDFWVLTLYNKEAYLTYGKCQSTIQPSINFSLIDSLKSFSNCSWIQPVQSNEVRVSCSRKQQEPTSCKCCHGWDLNWQT